MANFIKIEPSTDIHLVLDPNFKDSMGVALNNLPLKIWSLTRADPDPLSPPPPDTIYRRFDFNDISSNCTFDFYPIGQNYITLNGITLEPKNKGTAFMQIRYEDPIYIGYYHYLIVRIKVHDRLNGWWFGHEDDRMSVFQDNNLPHSQPSIYASFDTDNFVGDITGHNYVKLQSDNTSIIEVASNENRPYSGRIRGITKGTAKLTSTLKESTKKMDVEVINFVESDNKILELRWGAYDKPPQYKHNMLFIGEGFKDSSKLDEVVYKTTGALFNQSRHSPYNLLGDDINAWSVYKNSHHEGITTACQITENGFPFPFFDSFDSDDPVVIADASVPGGKKEVYTLKKLCELVGFSDKGLRERGVTIENINIKLPEIISQLKISWDTDPNAILLGYDKTKLPPDYGFQYANGVWSILAWILQTPMAMIPDTKDTFYGFVAGNRQGDLVSKIELLTSQVTSSSTPADFLRRIRQWYVPNNSNWNFPQTIDSRRLAPEIYYQEDNINSPWVIYFINKHISQLNNVSINPAEPQFVLGQIWDYNFTPTNQSTPETKSYGLVCFLINSARRGRSANNTGRFIGAIIGSESAIIDLNSPNPSVTIEIDQAQSTHRLKLNAEIKINYDSMIAMIAHEFGHSFALGDEYEEFRQYKEIVTDSVTNISTEQLVNGSPIKHIHRFDNLVHFIDLRPNLAPQTPVAGLPQPIDPEKIKWSVLHRTELSAKIIEGAKITSPDEITVKIHSNDIAKFRLLKEKNKKIFLRKMVVNFKFQNSKQLRLSASESKDDIFENLAIKNISAANELTLTSSTITFNTNDDEYNFIPAGSILYLPRMYEDGITPFTLIEKEVMNFMKTEKYDNSLPEGRALSENFDNVKNAPDGVSNEKDTPPYIPNFNRPCKDFRVIGAYEGGGTYVLDAFRPSGACKMRNQDNKDKEGEFCYVCKYLIVSRVNPSKLAKLDEEYPESKGRSGKSKIILDITLYPYHLIRNLLN